MPSPTAPPNSYQLIDAALARGEITRDQAALYKVYALFGARREIPTPFISTEPVPGDGTMLFLAALQDWDSLSQDTKNRITAFITPKQITVTAPARVPGPPPTPTSTPPRVGVVTPATPTKPSRHLPLLFIENVGQFDTRARFQMRGGNGTLWLTEDALWITVLERPAVNRQWSASGKRQAASENRKGVNLQVSFVGANPRARLEPFNRLNVRVAYFIGKDKTKWRTDVPVWGGVRYKDLYPGIDLELTSENGRIVQRVVARPGANMNAVRLRVEGADALSLDAERVQVHTAIGQFALPLLQGVTSEGKPLTRAETKPTVVGKEIIAPFATPRTSTTSGVSALSQDVLYATAIGGGGYDWGNSIVVDNAGAAYIVGVSYSAQFSSQSGLNTNAGYTDAFVAKLNSNGALAYAVFLGGSDADEGSGIAVDASGAAYITGSTWSSDFPTTDGSTYHDYGDVFVAKFDASGHLVHSTLFGGNNYDWGGVLARDASGALYLAGTTWSSDFYHTSGTLRVNGTTFVMKLNPSSIQPPVYSTLLNVGSDEYDSDAGGGIAANASGAAYITGSVCLNTKNDCDLYVAKLDASGSKVYVRTLGGSEDEWGASIAVDSAGAAYLTGVTNSADWAAPYGGGTCDAGEGGTRPCDDVVVVKVDAAGNPVYARFFGGAANDYGGGIAVNASGEAYVTGSIGSAVFTPYGGACDAFVVQLSAAGTLTYARALGGSADDGGSGIALDASGAVYVTGYTASTDFVAAYGDDDAFVVKLALGAPPTPTPTATATATLTRTPTPTPTPRELIWVGWCALTEYYNTPQGNFRIYYTRTYPNLPPDDPNAPAELDCRIQNPTRLAPNGYPDFVVELGSSLETSYTRYGMTMGYPVDRMPRESVSGRHPIYISSNPIWTGGIIDPINRSAIALPEHTFFGRGIQYNPSQPIDVLRVTGAHEFFHTLQWTYVPNAWIGGQGGTWVTSPELRWWMEATATWAQAKVCPQDGSYPAALDALLREPYRALTVQPFAATDDRAYGSFIFATFLEQKVANAETIIRQTWERYRANNGGSMLTAIDQVLRNHYNTNLASVFPAFTWHNYFMNAGTYDIQVTNVYTNPTTLPPAFTGPQWQLFRSHLKDARKDWQAGQAGVFVDQVGQFESYPNDGPAPGRPSAVDNLGSAYIEFFPTTLLQGRSADLNITLRVYNAASAPAPKVSIIPITDFAAHPGNDFVSPVFVLEGTEWIYRYTRTIPNFHQLNRVTVIISNMGDLHPFSYRAEVAYR